MGSPLLKSVIVILGYLVVTVVVGWVISFITKRLVKSETDERFRELVSAGLKNAGRYIGWLERTLILTFVLVDDFSGIGFVLATKGILRFGEIKESSHRKFAEYIILGTFLSFALAFIIGLFMKNLLSEV